MGFLFILVAAALCLHLLSTEDNEADDRRPSAEEPKKIVLAPLPPPLASPPEKKHAVPQKVPPLPFSERRQGSKVGERRIPVFPPNDSWRYLAGSDAPDDWAEADFNDNSWSSGVAGFGYGGNDNKTVLDMRRKYTRVYIRHAFARDRVQQATELGLMIRYNDAFIAYLNGKEVVRAGIKEGRGTSAKGIHKHGAGDFEYFPIGNWKELLQDRNVIAIEGHNVNLGSSDFTLNPYLVITP